MRAADAANGSPPTPRARGARVALVAAAPDASPEQAAAIVAALQRFMRHSAAAAPPCDAPAQRLDGWRRAAILEAVMREDDWEGSYPWINT